MKRLTVETYFTGPECSEIVVFASNGSRALAEHPERHDPQSMHYAPAGPREPRLVVCVPVPLSECVVKRMAELLAARRCVGKRTIVYSEPGVLGKWLRITH